MPPIVIGAEAYIELDQNDPNWTVRLRMTRVKFDKAGPMTLNPQYAQFKNTLTAPQQALLTAEEEKFYDLLLIGLNIAATEYAPKMVAAIDLPNIPVAKSKLQPTCFFLDDRVMTLGMGIDPHALAEFNSAAVASVIQEFSTRLEMDIERQGGWDAYIKRRTAHIKVSETNIIAPAPDGNPVTADSAAEEFPLAHEYIQRISDNPADFIRGSGLAPFQAAPNIALGVNEYLLANIVAQSLPAPKNKCTDWKEGLGGLVRGRTCSWSNVWGSHIDIAGTNVTGGVNFAFGGKADGCLHVFIPWKCRWEWECASIGITFTGSPVVTVQFSERQHDGLVFWLNIDGSSVGVSVIAPFPLDIVFSIFAQILVSFAIAIVQLVVSLTTFQFIPPQITIKQQKTKIQFSGFDAFAYTRPLQGTHAKNTFMGFECAMKGVN